MGTRPARRAAEWMGRACMNRCPHAESYHARMAYSPPKHLKDPQMTHITVYPAGSNHIQYTLAA